VADLYNIFFSLVHVVYVLLQALKAPQNCVHGSSIIVASPLVQLLI